VIGCWQVEDVLIDPGPTSALQRLLGELGGWRPRALLLTHIHLDHAGATGSLVERWPELEVYVHERGAPHLVDPSRLLGSARRLYGEEMDSLWGEMVPVPEHSIRVLSGGERVIDGAFEVAYTPGHASHHVSYLHGGTAYAGDTAGVRIGGALTIAPTPPPDIDVDAWHESIERLRGWEPERLAITHFGAYEDVKQQLDALARRLDQWAERARDQERGEFIAGSRAEIERSAGPEQWEAYELAAPADQLYDGLTRYWRKRAETAVAPGPASNRASDPHSKPASER
jgi:glyoxylase-like metal-dependent hydrolase (beta-lactamase superfamily II)